MRIIGLNGDTAANVAQALNELAGGRFNVGQSITLRTGQTTTVAPARGIGGKDIVILMPVTASAALEYGLGTTYILEASITPGASFTITHPSNATADKKYRYVWFATQ